MLVAAEETGVRPQELRKVEARHVDSDSGLWVFGPTEHKTGAKTGKPRLIFLTETALQLTKRLVQVFPDGPLFRNSRGNPWTSDGFRTSWHKAVKSAGIEGVTFNDLRGTAVTRLAEAGCTVPEIASITGHTLRSATTILERYRARTRKQASAAIQKLDEHRRMRTS